MAGTTLSPAVLHSTLGRHLARAIRACVFTEMAAKHWGLLVENIGRGYTQIFNPPVFPKHEIRGFGFHEAPRGVLLDQVHGNFSGHRLKTKPPSPAWIL